MSEQYSKGESQENSSVLSSQEEQQKKQVKPAELVNLPKGSSQSLIINEQTSTREERKQNSIYNVYRRKNVRKRFQKAATLKRKRSKPNPPLKQQDSQEQPTSSENKEEEGNQQLAQSLQLNPLLVPQQSVQQSETSSSQTKLRLNPKLKMKEQHHIYLYLSDCQDRSFEGMQDFQASATQFYSPQKQSKDQTSLSQINQEIFQETQYLIKILKININNTQNPFKVQIQTIRRTFTINILIKSTLSQSQERVDCKFIRNQDQKNKHRLENQFQKH